MKLTEALALVAGTSRGICRLNESEFLDPQSMDYTYEDLCSDDWIVEPEVVAKSLTVDDLKAAWESARSGMVSVKRAEDSKLFNNIKAVLFG